MPDVKFSNQYPYTDFHELNLDWVIKEVKYWSEKVGKTIQSIDLTGTVGLVDTYTINYSDGTTSTFDVTNGNGITSVAKTGTVGLVDTYTITFQDGSTTTFEVNNGTASVDPSLTLAGWAADAKETGKRIGVLEDILEIKTKTGTATHPGGTGTRTSLVNGISLKSGISYTITVSIPSAISATVYGYLKDANSTNLATLSISAGNTSNQRTFTASGDYDGCVLSFTVSTANITATGSITNNSLIFDDSIGRIDDTLTQLLAEIPINSTVASISGNIPSGGTLVLTGRSAIKDGQEIIFKSNISSFNKLRLDFTGGYSDNYIEFDSSNITVKNSSSPASTTAHGLTIANEVTLLIRLIKSHALIDLTSGGVTYSDDVAWNQTGAAVTEYTITSTGTVCTTATLTSVYTAARRHIWYFGDSYIAFGTDTRIPYYVYEYGYGDNILFSGASGGTSGSTNIALSTLLTHGRPHFAVFATGMNDGSDTASDPSASWLSAITSFINTCQTVGITPILCTVPTVPSVNNEQKNAWIRNSGHRFIDYADAVGADALGVWYSGMLSGDNIHPSTTGGNALFTQLLKDLPEIMGD